MDAQRLQNLQNIGDILSQPDLLAFWAHNQGFSIAHAKRVLLLATKDDHKGPNALAAEDKARFVGENQIRLQYATSSSSNASSRRTSKMYDNSTNNSSMSLGSVASEETGRR